MERHRSSETPRNRIPDFLALAIARQCHDAVNELRKSIGEKITEPDFESAPIVRQRELVEAVLWVAAHPDADAKVVHGQWCKVKRLGGWIPAARTNEDRKEHAYLFAWESLPLGQRRKDEVFLGTVRQCLAGSEFKDAIAELMALEAFGVTSDTLVRGVIMADSAIGLLDELATNMPLIRKHVSFTKLSDTLEQIKSYLSARDLLAVKVKKHQKETSKLRDQDSEKEKAKHEQDEKTAVPEANAVGNPGPESGGESAAKDSSSESPAGVGVSNGTDSNDAGEPADSRPGDGAACEGPPQTPPELSETGLSGPGGSGDPGGDGLDEPVGSPASKLGSSGKQTPKIG